MQESDTLNAITLQRNIRFRFKNQNVSFNKPYQMHLGLDQFKAISNFGGHPYS